MSEPVPPLDLGPGLKALEPRLLDAFRAVLRSGRFIGGPEVEGFEREAAEWLGVAHAVGLNSGTDALMLGLRALGIGPGDRVAVPAFTFFATPEVVSQLGAEPVFVDIEPDGFGIDPERFEDVARAGVDAVVPVHLFGRPADMEAVGEIARERGIPVLEDCAQSFGATVEGRRTGSFGRAGAFSFYPTKNLGALGDGGLLATDDPELAATVCALGNHGERERYRSEMLGWNSRLDALQAAALRLQLPLVDARNAARREAARRYEERLQGLPDLTLPPIVRGHVFHQYTVRIADGRRDAVRDALARDGIAAVVYYPIPCHRQPPYAAGAPRLREAERAAAEVLSLPLWPEIEASVQDRVAESLRRALAPGG